ncbi:unnamed protein product [Didymodactylos carnosus]|uniref:Uncharacterized protein n=1 Tax=Didymodactylos carnosus TaxID=1234261 RepID=A0A815JI94_9BILA|nr:unnamed protein product [Didymodactylos carnosus]CAF4276610.1 unnamed protein product [Didymodactylos carnosus]
MEWTIDKNEQQLQQLDGRQEERHVLFETSESGDTEEMVRIHETHVTKTIDELPSTGSKRVELLHITEKENKRRLSLFIISSVIMFALAILIGYIDYEKPLFSSVDKSLKMRTSPRILSKNDEVPPKKQRQRNRKAKTVKHSNTIGMISPSKQDNNTRLLDFEMARTNSHKKLYEIDKLIRILSSRSNYLDSLTADIHKRQMRRCLTVDRTYRIADTLNLRLVMIPKKRLRKKQKQNKYRLSAVVRKNK